MKQTDTRSYVNAIRGKRNMKIHVSDIKRIFKLEKKIYPQVPFFHDSNKSLILTDSE
jgi:hypothetical protein